MEPDDFVRSFEIKISLVVASYVGRISLMNFLMQLSTYEKSFFSVNAIPPPPPPTTTTTTLAGAYILSITLLTRVI